MTRLLLADADASFAGGVQRLLERRGFAVEFVADGTQVLNRILMVQADACVLGAELGSIDGFTVLRRARAWGALMPVLALAVADTAAARLQWFDAGADDVLNRPFELDELVARLRARCARAGHRPVNPNPSCGPLVLDVDSEAFFLNGERLALTPQEHALVCALISRPGYVVPRERILRVVFREGVRGGALDVLACRVRRKLAVAGLALTTVRGMGFLLEEVGGVCGTQAISASKAKAF